MVLELVILGATLLLISLRRLAHLPIERPASALVGGVLMVIFGFVGADAVVEAIDWETILLLIGMMLVVAVLEGTGLFGAIAEGLVARAKTPVAMLVLVVTATAVLSALVLNDAVVLFFTPVLILTCRRLGRNPIPYVIASALAANVGSVATPVGNPQNAYIATRAGLSFTEYASRMVPPALLALAVMLAVLAVLYRQELSRPFEPTTREPMHVVQSNRLVVFGWAGLGLMAVALTASGPLGLPLHVVAIAAGAILVFSGPLIGGPTTKQSMRLVDWNVILLFLGLFIVLAGVRSSELFTDMLAVLPGSYDGPGDFLVLTLVTAVLANLVSNVPAVLLIAESLPLADPEPWFVLAAASTLAGNATLVGAAANLIVAERAEEHGVVLRAWPFARVGIPVTILTLWIAVFWLIR